MPIAIYAAFSIYQNATMHCLTTQCLLVMAFYIIEMIIDIISASLRFITYFIISPEATITS